MVAAEGSHSDGLLMASITTPNFVEYSRLEEYRAAGCTHILLELWGDDRRDQARLFGQKVLPHFSRR